MAGPPTFAFTVTGAKVGAFAVLVPDSLGVCAYTASWNNAIAHKNTAAWLILILIASKS